MECAYCGEKIKILAFKCHHCGESFCVDCRLPEEHKCQSVEVRSWHNFAENVLKLKT